MAWSWSHTHEAYENAYNNLSNLDREDLMIIFAEWRAAQEKGGSISDFNPGFDQRKYDRALAYAATLDNSALIEFIWEHAESFATCDNGGFNAWVCPHGCHTVSFDPEIDPDKLYWFTSSSGMVEFQLPGQCVIDCSHSGQCDDDISHWLAKLDLDLDPDKLASELREYGAWDQDELSNHDDNLARILWSAACDLSETITQGEYND